ADGAKVNGINIVATDVLASNGVIHVIDGVLLPAAEEAPAEEMAPAAEAPAEMPTTGASSTNTTLVTVLVSALLVLMLGGFALVARRSA
ncbi:MAG: fasciclin domain-containing protein, partial [Caldilineaceae bacterium]